LYWYYEDSRGFEPIIIQHATPINEEEKSARKMHRPINHSLEATIRKEIEKIVNSRIIFIIEYSKWVSNLVLVKKKNNDIRLCVDL
jgi:hypothetical protein